MKVNKTKSSKFKPDKPKKNTLTVTILGALLIVLSLAIFFGLRTAFQTDSYYVLTENVPAKREITSDILEEVVVNKDGVPPTAITKGQVESGGVVSKIPLEKGDILTASNTGVSLDTSAGIPDDWVVTSLNISSNDAVGGQVARGDYFDIIGITDAGAKYIATNVLALDVSSAQVEQEGKSGTVMNTELQYLLGAPPEVAGLIASATNSDVFSSIKIVLSPRSIRYKQRELEKLNGVFKAEIDTKVIDLQKGTDPKFSPVLRDKNERPVNKENCEAGVIEPATYCDKLKQLEGQNDKEKPEEQDIQPKDMKEVEEDIKENKEKDEKEEQKDTDNKEEDKKGE